MHLLEPLNKPCHTYIIGYRHVTQIQWTKYIARKVAYYQSKHTNCSIWTSLYMLWVPIYLYTPDHCTFTVPLSVRIQLLVCHHLCKLYKVPYTPKIKILNGRNSSFLFKVHVSYLQRSRYHKQLFAFKYTWWYMYMHVLLLVCTELHVHVNDNMSIMIKVL